MTRGATWSLDSLDPRTRGAAREAARRAGLPVEDWIATVIETEAAPSRPRQRLMPDDPGIDERLDEISDRLDHLTRRVTSTAVPPDRIGRAGRSLADEVEERLAEVALRAAESERRATAALAAVARMGRAAPDPAGPGPSTRDIVQPAQEAVAEIERRVAEIDKAIAELNRKGQAGPAATSTAETASAGGDALGFDDLVAEITARQRSLDARPASVFGSPPLAPVGMAGGDATARLEQNLADLAREIEELRAVPPVDGHAIERQIGRLADEIQALRRSGPAPIGRAEIDGLEERLSSLARTLRPDPAELAALRRELKDLARMVEAMAPQRALDALVHEMQDLGRRLETSRACGFEPRIVSGIERALAGLESSIRGLPGAEAFDGIAREVVALNRRIDDLSRRGGDPAAFAAVQDQIRDLRSVVAHGASDATVAALAAEVRALAERLDRVVTPSIVPDAAFEGIERRLDDIARAQSAPVAAPLLESLETRLDDLITKVGTREPHGVDALLGEIRDRLGRVENAVEMPRGLGDILAVVAERLDQSPAPASADPELERHIAALAEKLDRLGEIRDDGQVREMERQLLKLSEAIEKSEERFSQLGTIERGIADLFVHLEETRASAIETAERVAREALARTGSGDDAKATQAAVATLEAEIERIRTAQDEAGRRTQSMLEAVHAALERVVDRLNTVEPPSQPAAIPGATDDAEPPPAPPSAVRQGVREGRMPAARAPDAVRPTRPGPAGAMGQPAPALYAESGRELSPDHPLEPGSGAPKVRPVRAADRVAASEAALAGVAPRTAVDTPSKANFIAAARRAAQAAAAEAAVTPNPAEEKKSRLPNIELGSIKDTFARHRRAIMVGVGTMLLLIGTLQVVSNMLSPRTPPAPPAMTAPALPPPMIPGTVPEAPATSPAPGQSSAVSPRPDPLMGGAPNAGLVGSSNAARMMTAPELLQPPATTAAIASVGANPGRVASAVPPSVAAPATAPTTVAATPAATPSASPVAPGMTVAEVRPATPRTADGLPASIGPMALRLAAAQGDPGAQYEIAVRFAEGRGVPQNMEESARWLARAAESGLAPARYRLGSMYEKGHGVRRDTAEARRLYALAAEVGHAKAMHNLAVMFAEGAEGRPDYATAARWFRQAADHGVTDSQYNLGILYARGLGVETNLAESFRWFSLAASGGDTDAARKRDDVGARLDTQTLQAARATVMAWRVEPQPGSAVTVPAPEGGWERLAGPAELDERALARRAQQLLTRLGFDVGPADGSIGRRTREAIRTFEQRNGLPQTGRITPALVERLSRAAG